MASNILEYKDPKFLNTLALRTVGIRDKGAGFSVTLRPDIDELLDVVEERKIVEAEKSEDYFERRENENAAYYKKIHELCVKHQIIPFVGPKFDGGVMGPPELEYKGWRYRPTQHFSYDQNEKFKEISDELWRKSEDPLNFFGSNNWYFVEFKDIKGEKDKEWHVKKLAEVIKKLIGEGYRVTGIRGELNIIEKSPLHTSYETSFDAMRGSVHFFGSFNIPEDFDIERAVDKQETGTLEELFEGLLSSVASR